MGHGQGLCVWIELWRVGIISTRRFLWPLWTWAEKGHSFLCSVVLLIASTLLIISVCWECFCDFLQLQMCRTFTKSLPVVVSLKWIVKWTIHESSVVTHTCATDKGQLSCAYKVWVETNGWTRPNLWPSLLMWLVINCIVGVQVIVTCQVQKQMKEVNGENSHLKIMCFHDKWISHLLLAASDVSIVKCLFISNWYIFQLVSGFQTDAQNRSLEAEETRNKLSSLRRLIARLLKSINDVSRQRCTTQAVHQCFIVFSSCCYWLVL